MSQKKPLVIITGASSGIGAACAKQFSAAGYPLLILARRLNRLEALNLPDTICAKVDVTNKTDFANAVKKAEAKYGPADLLINNAGVMILEHFLNQDPQAWETMINVNINGVLTGMHLVLQDMVKQHHGTIVNISSVAGRWAFDAHAVYCGTKYFVHALTETVRREIAGSHVRLITVDPGIVDTELLNSTDNQKILSDYMKTKNKIHGGITADEIASIILFAYQQPQHVAIKELVIANTDQAV